MVSNSDKQQIAIGLAFLFVLFSWGIGIYVGSRITQIDNEGDWRDRLERTLGGESLATNILYKSWQKVPFVDVYPTLEQTCPPDFPDDTIYDIWPGTRGHCDCLQREEGRDYFLNQMCGENDDVGCYDKAALAPVVMNRILGVRYCGKRGSESLADMQRPIQYGDNQTAEYRCPEGFKPCNPEFFLQPGGADYVVCKSIKNFDPLDCPITSIKFVVSAQERIRYDYKFKGIAGT